MLFADRADVGRRLARSLSQLRGTDVAVLALPHGGVPVAAEVECRVSAFPVLDADGKVRGVVSEADLPVKEAMLGEPAGAGGVPGRHRAPRRLVYPAPVPSSPGPYL